MKTFFAQLFVSLFLIAGSFTNMAAGETPEKTAAPLTEEEIAKLYDITEENTRYANGLPKNLGMERLSDDDVAAALKVYEASEKILAQDVTEEVRTRTLKRRAIALILLAYERTPEFFPKLDAAIDELEDLETGELLFQVAEKEALTVATLLLLSPQPGNATKGIRIDPKALAERLVDFGRDHSDPSMVNRFIMTLCSPRIPANRRDELLKVVAPVFAEYAETVKFDQGSRIQAAARFFTLPGKPMQIVGHDVQGKPFDPKPFGDKVVLVQFWGTWCAPCMQEMPELIRLYEKYKPYGFEILGVNTGFRDDARPEKVRAFLAEKKFDGKKITWTNLYESPQQENETLCRYYGIEELPVMVLIGRDGKVARVNPQRGPLEQLIIRALDQDFSRDDLTEEEKARYDAARKKNEQN